MPMRFPFLQKKEVAEEIDGVAEARAKAREIIVEAKEKAFELEKNLSRKEAVLEEKERELQKKEKHLSQKLEEVEEVKQKHLRGLEKIASLTKEEASQKILAQTEENLQDEIARRIKQAEETIRERSDEKTKDILISAIQQAATDYVADYTVSRVKLPDEEVKGRIIGKEGRNIKAFERATGVEVEVDETPKEVRLSCFDAVRREIARQTLEKLIADGRIQPTRIEETVAKVKKQMAAKMKEDGEQLAYDAGVPGLPEEIVKLLGRYQFRTSYGQNLVSHSLEVLNLAKYIAEELHADVELVKKAALLHDLGKVMTAEAEGPHAALTREILEKQDFDEKLINAAAAHHEEEEFKSVEAVIIHVADAISGARPGARFENFDKYVERMREFEDLAKSFDGVEEAQALSAGREIRVILKPTETDDAAVTKLAHDIARKVEDQLTYPGEVKVTVIREVREEGVAK